MRNCFFFTLFFILSLFLYKGSYDFPAEEQPKDGVGNSSFEINSEDKTAIELPHDLLTAVKNSTISDNAGSGIFVRSGATLTESGNTFSNNEDGHISN